jgi:hypothetical protein
LHDGRRARKAYHAYVNHAIIIHCYKGWILIWYPLTHVSRSRYATREKDITNNSFVTNILIKNIQFFILYLTLMLLVTAGRYMYRRRETWRRAAGGRQVRKPINSSQLSDCMYYIDRWITK